MAGRENFMGTLAQGAVSTGWHPLPSGKSTLKVLGTYTTGTVTFKVGKRNKTTLAIKEGSLLTDGVFDTATASVRNINYGSDASGGFEDVISADLTGEDGSTDLDIFIAPYEGPR